MEIIEYYRIVWNADRDWVNMRKTISTLIVTTVLAVAGSAQSGGSYTIEKSVIANGGGTSTGGAYSIEGTIGQPIAGGPASGSPFSLQSGFWNLNLAPTAAGVQISGRVISRGRPVKGSIVLVTRGDGTILRANTNTFGYFSIVGLTAGETVLITARHGRFQFTSQLVNLSDTITGFEIVAL